MSNVCDAGVYRWIALKCTHCRFLFQVLEYPKSQTNDSNLDKPHFATCRHCFHCFWYKSTLSALSCAYDGEYQEWRAGIYGIFNALTTRHYKCKLNNFYFILRFMHVTLEKRAPHLCRVRPKNALNIQIDRLTYVACSAYVCVCVCV